MFGSELNPLTFILSPFSKGRGAEDRTSCILYLTPGS
jgi:hypothetical protein